MIELPDYIEDLVNAGIDVTIKKDFADGMLGFDLNSMAKSEMFLFNDPKDGQWKIRGRYNFEEPVEDLEDLMSIFRRFYEMRNFGNGNWLSLLVNHGMMERVENITVTYR